MTPSAPFNAWKILSEGNFLSHKTCKHNSKYKRRYLTVGYVQVHILNSPQINCAFPRLLLHSLYASD